MIKLIGQASSTVWKQPIDTIFKITRHKMCIYNYETDERIFRGRRSFLNGLQSIEVHIGIYCSVLFQQRNVVFPEYLLLWQPYKTAAGGKLQPTMASKGYQLEHLERKMRVAATQLANVDRANIGRVARLFDEETKAASSTLPREALAIFRLKASRHLCTEWLKLPIYKSSLYRKHSLMEFRMSNHICTTYTLAMHTLYAIWTIYLLY